MFTLLSVLLQLSRELIHGNLLLLMRIYRSESTKYAWIWLISVHVSRGIDDFTLRRLHKPPYILVHFFGLLYTTVILVFLTRRQQKRPNTLIYLILLVLGNAAHLI